MTKKLIREPLLHFLLIGAALFGISWMVNRNAEPAEADTQIIIIDSAVIGKINSLYQQHTGVMPAPSQEDSLIQQYVNIEMLYREALQIGLDKDNDSLKTLLAGQMSVAYNSDAPIDMPTDEEIRIMLADKSWYVNDSGFADTSAAFLEQMKPKIRSRHRQLKTAAQLAEKMKNLNSKYKVIKDFK